MCYKTANEGRVPTVTFPIAHKPSAVSLLIAWPSDRAATCRKVRRFVAQLHFALTIVAKMAVPSDAAHPREERVPVSGNSRRSWRDQKITSKIMDVGGPAFRAGTRGPLGPSESRNEASTAGGGGVSDFACLPGNSSPGLSVSSYSEQVCGPCPLNGQTIAAQGSTKAPGVRQVLPGTP